MIRVALAQINTTVGDLQGNKAKILAYLAKAKEVQADIVVFPELAVTGYPPEDLLYKAHFVRDNQKVLRQIAGQVSGISAVIGFVNSDKTGNLYNAAAVISAKKVQGIYHKQGLPNYGVFDEKRYFVEGRHNPLFTLGDVCFGVNICEDIWQDYGIYVSQAQRGAVLLINVSSSPYDYEKLERRERLLAERARRCKLFICYANLVGGQDELVFDGDSMVVNPQGKIVARARQFEEDLLVVDIPVGDHKKRKSGGAFVHLPHKKEPSERPAMRTQITGWLSRNERIYQALVLGTGDYVRKNGFQKVVLGLSGGIDSSLVALIAREAIGEKNVIGITMPSQFSSEGTRNDAAQVAHNLGISFLEIPIATVHKAYLDTLKDAFAGSQPGVAEENIQARIRGNILMAFSNKFGWLVLTTGNKSEIAAGYCTLYGDMSGGFAVIKDVPKTKVYEVARLGNEKTGYPIPETVFRRPPTAELRPGQKDEDSLPPYNVLDSILEAYVQDHKSLKSIIRKCRNAAMVKEVMRMVDKSEYKRRQAPPGIKITPRAFGKDWRLPITNKYQES